MIQLHRHLSSGLPKRRIEWLNGSTLLSHFDRHRKMDQENRKERKVRGFFFSLEDDLLELHCYKNLYSLLCENLLDVLLRHNKTTALFYKQSLASMPNEILQSPKEKCLCYQFPVLPKHKKNQLFLSSIIFSHSNRNMTLNLSTQYPVQMLSQGRE